MPRLFLLHLKKTFFWKNQGSVKLRISNGKQLGICSRLRWKLIAFVISIGLFRNIFLQSSFLHVYVLTWNMLSSSSYQEKNTKMMDHFDSVFEGIEPAPEARSIIQCSNKITSIWAVVTGTCTTNVQPIENAQIMAAITLWYVIKWCRADSGTWSPGHWSPLVT